LNFWQIKRREAFLRMTLGAGELGCGRRPVCRRYAGVERFKILVFPGDQIDEGIVGTIMFGMALRHSVFLAWPDNRENTLVAGSAAAGFRRDNSGIRRQTFGGMHFFAAKIREPPATLMGRESSPGED